MKRLKKILALALAMAMVLSMSAISAFAEPAEKFTYSGTDATQNGKITVSNATVGETYTLYKIFDATYDATDATKISYTVKAGALKDALDSDYFTVGATADANGNYSVTRTMQAAPNQDKPVKTDEELITYIKTLKNNFTQIGTIEASASSISFEKIPYGYYYIESSLGAAVTIDSNNPTATVIDKNQKTTMDKAIVENGNEVKANQAALEKDGTSYKITVNATNFDGEEKIYKYEISDTLDPAMTYTSAPVIKVDNAAPLGDNPAYSIVYYKADGTTTTETLAEAQSFKITLNWTKDGTFSANHLYGSNATIVVTYDAKLDPAKAVTSGQLNGNLEVGGTTEANTNTATVKNYKDKTQPDEERTTPNGEVGTEKTETFTTELTVLKVDQDEKALEGAEFTLTGPNGSVIITTKDTFTESGSGTYWLLKDGTYTATDPAGPNGDGKDEDGRDIDQTVYASTTTKYAKTSETVVKGAGQTDTSITAAVGSDGKVTFTGLGKGQYKLVESKVPAGYNKVADITFNVDFNVTYKTVNGKQVIDSVAFTADNGINVEADNTLITTIKNNKGTELPSTGGIGTTIFYVVGTILVIGAGVVLITRRRMEA